MKLVPAYNEKSETRFAFPFEELVKLTDDVSIRTGALKVGQPVDLLSISTDELLIESGEQDCTDCIDQRDFVIEKLYYQLNGSDKVEEFSAEMFPALKLRVGDAEGQMHPWILRGGYEIKTGWVNNGHAVPPIQIHASLDLQTGRLLVTASDCKAGKVIGYSINGNRYNPNRRSRPVHAQFDYVQATIDDLGVGLTVYRDHHGHDPIHLTEIGFEAKTASSRPGHRWVVLNDTHLFKISGNHLVEGLWCRKSTQQ